MRGGESAEAAYGRLVHAQFDYGAGFRPEFELPSGRRVDAINFETREIIELKPNTPAAIAKGARQISQYLTKLDRIFPGEDAVDRLSRNVRQAMTDRDVVQKTLDEFGRVAGMHKHSGAWYGFSAGTWTVVQLQKSQYTPAYYINTGFWIRAAGDKPYPKERDFHIRARLDALLPDLDYEISQLLDPRTELPDLERSGRLESILRLRLIPLLRRGSTVTGLREMYREGLFKAAGVRGEALAVLNAAPA